MVRETVAQGQTLCGRMILTPEQEIEERRRVESAHRQEAQARQHADDEVERLRRELELLRSQGVGDTG